MKIWLVVWNIFYFPFHINGMSSQPHWRTPWFFKMVKSTSQLWVKPFQFWVDRHPFQLSSGSDELSDWIEPFSTVRSPLELQSFPTIWIHIMDPYESIWIHLTKQIQLELRKTSFSTLIGQFFVWMSFFVAGLAGETEAKDWSQTRLKVPRVAAIHGNW